MHELPERFQKGKRQFLAMMFSLACQFANTTVQFRERYLLSGIPKRDARIKLYLLFSARLSDAILSYNKELHGLIVNVPWHTQDLPCEGPRDEHDAGAPQNHEKDASCYRGCHKTQRILYTATLPF